MDWNEWLEKIVSNTLLFIAHSLDNYTNFVFDIIMITNKYIS